jgi:CBS-domain-containing membrane protein
MTKLNLYSAAHIHHLEQPQTPSNISVRSPATVIVTDFSTQQPRVIEANVKASDAEHLMFKAHVRMNIVVDQHDHFLGLISLKDLSGQEIMKKVVNGYDRHEVTVKDLMKSKQTLKVLDYAQLSRASIMDVMSILANDKEQHCLVVNQQTEKVSGVISASDIARKLNIPIAVQQSPSFEQVYVAYQNTKELVD